MTRETAIEKVLALVARARGLGQASRHLAANLDIPGVPPRFAERAADTATELERLAADLAAYFKRGG